MHKIETYFKDNSENCKQNKNEMKTISICLEDKSCAKQIQQFILKIIPSRRVSNENKQTHTHTQK